MTTKRWQSIVLVLLLVSLLGCNREPLNEAPASSPTITPTQPESLDNSAGSKQEEEAKVDEMQEHARNLSEALTSFKQNPSDSAVVSKIEDNSNQLEQSIKFFAEKEDFVSDISFSFKNKLATLNLQEDLEKVIQKITNSENRAKFAEITNEQQLSDTYRNIVEDIDALDQDLRELTSDSGDSNLNDSEEQDTDNDSRDGDRNLEQEDSFPRIVILVAFVLSLGLLLGFIVFAFKKSSQHQSRRGRDRSIGGNQTQGAVKPQLGIGNIQTRFLGTSSRPNRKTSKYLTQDDLAPILNRIDDIDRRLQHLANQSTQPLAPKPSRNPPRSSDVARSPHQPLPHQPSPPANSLQSRPTWQPPKAVPSLEEQVARQYNQNSSFFKNRANVVDESEHTAGERRAGSRVAITLEKNRRGNYWLIEEAGELLLLPKAGINVNEHNYKTLELMFDCYNAQPGYTKTFNLLKPAKVNRQWQVIEKGQLQF